MLGHRGVGGQGSLLHRAGQWGWGATPARLLRGFPGSHKGGRLLLYFIKSKRAICSVTPNVTSGAFEQTLCARVSRFSSPQFPHGFLPSAVNRGDSRGQDTGPGSEGPHSATRGECQVGGLAVGEGQWAELIPVPARDSDSPPWGSGQVGQASLSFPRCKMGGRPFSPVGGPGGL